MLRPVSRSLLRSAQSSLAPARTIGGRRFISTEPPHLRGRSWKSSAARWGIAVAGIYYYNTSSVFAEQPSNNLLNPNVEALDDSEPSTIEALTSRRSSKARKDTSVLESAVQTTSSENASQTSVPVSTDLDDSTSSSSPGELAAEAEGQGAFNEETGEINWDCPCLGGMAHGPCGPEFREAFSCFVFSKEEPKGMDCIDKFKGMQDCFQLHPEIYKGELEDDDDLDPEAKAEMESEIAARREEVEKQQKDSQSSEDGMLDTESTSQRSALLSSQEKPQTEAKLQPSSEPHAGMSEEHEAINEGQASAVGRTPRPPPVEKQKFDEDLELMPKSWHDSRDSRSASEK